MRSRVTPIIRILLLLLLSSSLSPGWGIAAEAEPPPDEVTVRDTTLKGWILDLDTDSIHFRTIYGKGEISIRYEEIDHIQTQREFSIYQSDGEPIKGRLVGMENDSLLVATESDTVLRLKSGVIVRGVPAVAYEESWIERIRSRYPWWKAHLDAGWEFERTAVDTNKIFLGFNAEHRRSPTRFLVDLRYEYETQKPVSEPKTTSKDEMHAFLRGEYDLDRKWFLFSNPGVEWDRPRGIDVRAYPNAGLGYRFVETEKSLFQLGCGPGYVYEEFTDQGDNEYAAIYMDLEARYDFRSYFVTLLRMLYMPDIRDFRENWLFRAELEFSIPITQVLAMKLRFTNVNDNNPTPDVGNNKFKTNLLLSFGF
jgi:hypothetical protein